MSDGRTVRVFLSRRFEEFSWDKDVNANARELVNALGRLLKSGPSDGVEGVVFEVVDLMDRSSALHSAEERSIEGVKACDLLVVLLGNRFSGIVRQEVETAARLGKGVLAYRLPDVNPLSGQPLPMDEEQRSFLHSLIGLDRPVTGQLSQAIYNVAGSFDQYAEARRIRDDLRRALSGGETLCTPPDRSNGSYAGGPLPWGLIGAAHRPALVVHPGFEAIRAALVESGGPVDGAGQSELIPRPGLEPHAQGSVAASGEIAHGEGDVLVLHRPRPSGYVSTEISMEATGAVVGAWVQVQQVVVAWASPSGTELVRLSRASGTRLAVERIASAPLQRVVGLVSGWVGLTGDGALVVGPGAPVGLGRLGTEVAGRWIDLDVAVGPGGPIILGLVQTADADTGHGSELVAASLGAAAVSDVRRVSLDVAGERVFASPGVDGEPRAHVYGRQGTQVVEPFAPQGAMESTSATWR